MSWIQFSIIIVGILVLYFGAEILRNLPLRRGSMKFKAARAGAKRFGVWISQEDFWFDEFEVGHVDEWHNGHKFSVFGDAQFELNSEEQQKIKRSTFNFYSTLHALSDSNIIGWGKIGEKSIELHVSLTPETAKNLFDEIRRYPAATLHAHGFEDEDGRLKIEYFRYSPSVD